MKIKEHIIQGQHWAGTQAETLEYYRRHTQSILDYFTLRQTDFDRHFDATKLDAALLALARLQVYLSWKELEREVVE